MAEGNVNGFNFNTWINKSSQDNVKSLFQFPSSTLDIERRHANIGYKHNINEKWQIDTNFTYNYHQVAFDISNSRSTRTDSQDYLLEVSAIGKITDDAKFVGGITYEKLHGTIGNISATPTHFDTYRYGGYGQISWQADSNNLIVIGGQINKSKNTDSDISPRLAFIHSFNEHWTGKLLVGKAFRSPFATDLFLNSPSLHGNPDLSPEYIITFDGQLIYAEQDLSAAITLYRSEHKDLHKRVVIEDTPTFSNSGKVNYRGIEFEFKNRWAQKLEVQLNASYQTNKDEFGIKDSTYNPNTMIKMGVNYLYSPNLVFGLFNNYFAKPTQPNDLNIEPASINEKAGSYHLTTANLRYSLADFFKQSQVSSATVSLLADNIFDKTIYFPSINRTNVSTLPHHNGRSFTLTLDIVF